MEANVNVMCLQMVNADCIYVTVEPCNMTNFAYLNASVRSYTTLYG